MEKIKVVGIKFDYLTEQEQYELYSKDKEKYKEQASRSVYSTIREMVARDNCEAAKLSKDAEFLNQLLRDEIHGSKNVKVMNSIIENEAFIIEKTTLCCLVENLK